MRTPLSLTQNKFGQAGQAGQAEQARQGSGCAGGRGARYQLGAKREMMEATR
ncbi:MAG: hypothetical protein ACI89G_000156 [Minisyncoccia bacterium]|jgi:hypothetical protein